MRRPLAIAVLALLAGFVLAACGEKDEDTSAGLPVGCQPVEAPPPKTEQLRRPSLRPELRGKELTALVQTTCGPFEIALATDQFAKTTSSFIHLVEAGFYKGTQFS